MGTKVIDGNIDLKGGALINSVLESLGAEPGSVLGRIFLDTAQGEFKVSLDGASFTTVATLDDLTEAGITLEQAVDSLGSTVLTEGANINIAYDDAANSGEGAITISADIDGGDAATVEGEALADLRDRSTHTGTQASGTISDFNSAVQSIVDAATAALIDSAPGTLDTLNEIAAALQDDPNVIAALQSGLAERVKQYSETYGDGVETSFAISHNLDTEDVQVSIRLVSGGSHWIVPWWVDSANQITINHQSAPATDAMRVTVQAKSD